MSISVMTRVWAHSRFGEGALLVLLAIADFADDDGHAYPSVKTLARKARMTERNVQYSIRRLVAANELEVRYRAGPRGCNLFMVKLTSGVQAELFDIKSGRRGVKPGAAGGEADDAGGEAGRTGTVKPTAPKPSVDPSADPSAKPSRAERAVAIPTSMPTERQIARELHRFGREAERIWTAAARRAGSPYITRGHLRQVHELAIEATRWADEAQVLRAIEQRLDAASAPIRIPEWARLQQADEAEDAHTARKMVERAERDVIVEHEGRRYIGHVPIIVGGGACSVCGRPPLGHVLARPEDLRPIGGVAAAVAADAARRAG